MKIALVVLVLFFGFGVFAQTHHFNNNSTTLIKTTDQSPAHWYIEIFNDVGVDTTLRWKAFFENVPSQWQINFDDQNNNYPNVQDGDSADFTLFVTQQIPQKLIIGAMLNNTPADASVYFEIYNPAVPAVIDTIVYHFIVSSGTQGLSDLMEQNIIDLDKNILRIINDKPTDFSVLDETGRLILSAKQTDQINLSSLKSGQIYFLALNQGKERYLLKWAP
jgi:hypothetical protein